MTHQELQRRLPSIVNALVASIQSHPNIQYLDRVPLPQTETVIECLKIMQQLMYPGYFGRRDLASETLDYRVGALVGELTDLLHKQVFSSLRYRQHIAGSDQEGAGQLSWDESAANVVSQFLDRLPDVRETIASDVQAVLDGDPAAHDANEAILCYPGLLAITTQRLAHELFVLDVPFVPRIMTEYAHSLTGIDIHPGAKLGRNFFIDHGTGVVIGETTEVGNNVKIYQGVTLGALALLPHELKKIGKKRHPTIEDDVTIFSGATILGGQTVIGKGAVISGNVFITTSVPPMHVVSGQDLHVRTFHRREDVVKQYYQI